MLAHKLTGRISGWMWLEFGLIRSGVALLGPAGLILGNRNPRLRLALATLAWTAACYSISLMCALTQGFGSNYLVGIVLCLVGASTIEFMSPPQIAAWGTSAFVFHLFINGLFDKHIEPGEVPWSTFMLGGALVLCLVGSMLIDQQRRRLSPLSLSSYAELSSLAGALDGMQKDIQAKILLLNKVQTELQAKVLALETGNQEIRTLNDELRRQIEQRPRQLLDFSLTDRYRITGVLGSGGMGAVYEVERSTDLKPDNVLVGAEGPGTVKLADFGISILREVQASALQRAISGDRFEKVAAISADKLAALEAGIKETLDLQGAAQARSAADGAARTLGGIVSVAGPALPAQALIHGPSAGSSLTQTGTILGTPVYMAPELAVGSNLAQTPADLFSFGVPASEILTGELPFSRPAIVAYALGQELKPPQLSEKRPDLVPVLGQLLQRCLDVDPARRPSAAQLRDALARSI